jgi:hypothetical protein
MDSLRRRSGGYKQTIEHQVEELYILKGEKWSVDILQAPIREKDIPKRCGGHWKYSRASSGGKEHTI